MPNVIGQCMVSDTQQNLFMFNITSKSFYRWTAVLRAICLWKRGHSEFLQTEVSKHTTMSKQNKKTKGKAVPNVCGG